MKSGNGAGCGGAVDAHAETTEGTGTLLSRALKYTLPPLLLLALFTTSPLYTRLLSTAIPPPGTLPPLNTRSDFTLQKLFAPIFLLFVALLIPARTRLQRWLVSGAFIPAILYIHWENLACGSRSPAFAYALGAFCAHHAYQTLDLLLLSCPRTTFFRVPIHIQRMHILTGEPIPPCSLEAYPATALSRRIHWVFELVTTMRYVGWHTPDSRPTTPAHLLLAIDPTLRRSRFVMMLLVHLVTIGVLLDVLVWNIRQNHTAFYFPQLLAGGEGGEVVFTHNVPAVAIYPYPPHMAFSPRFPWLISLPQNTLYTPPPYPIPPPKYFPPPTTTTYLTPPLHALAQALSIYAAITGVWALMTLATMLLGYLVYPPYTSSTTSIQASRWFNPAAYPHPFTFSSHDLAVDVGVGAFWGKCWHAMFRRGFVRPWVVLRGWVGAGGGRATSLLLLMGTFALSGILHLYGVHTATGAGGWGCIVFFVVQPLAILAENAVAHIWAAAALRVGGGAVGGRVGKSKRIFELAVAYVWTITWLAYTSQWFFEDLAWGAAWRVEAAPVSLWRGALGEGWFRWGVHRDAAGAEWGWWEWSLGGRGWGVVI